MQIKPGEQSKSEITESEYFNFKKKFKNIYIFIHILLVLKRVFDSFDQDKTGRINSSELERVLQSLNVNLSKQAYEQILKEGDRDCINTL